MADSYIPIDCSLHDYIEIACLKHYQLRLELIDTSELIAIAESTETRSDKTEWLLLRDGDIQHTVRLDNIVALTPLATDPIFGRIVLRD
ncbi:MAG: transcriptional antiterminator [Gammaproteobacteria bacterium]|nr:MAG: transcriptional antiterminator [Gammaproteobacteria bacterium]